MKSIAALSVLVVACAASCGPAPAAVTPAPAASPAVHIAAPPPAAPRPVSKTTLNAVGLDSGALDRSANPCDDFYQFTCGGWVARTQIPGDEASWGSFSVVEKRVEEQLRDILQHAGDSSDDRDVGMGKLADYYGGCMDEGAIEAAGIAPIKPLLTRAAKVTDARSIATLLADLHKARIWAMFDLSAAQDMKDATRMLANLDQNGLGLPDRDYYTKDDDASKKTRGEYEQHVERMMKLAGMRAADARKAAEHVMQLETDLARASKTRLQRRDPKDLYNKLDRAGLAKLAPDFPWDVYLAAVGLPDIRELNATSLPFFEALDNALKTTKPEVWRNYLQWQIVHHTARALPKRFVDESFTLEKLLTGQPDQRVRWKRCVESTDGAMGELLAQPFVTRHFGGESKRSATTMVHQIRKAFAANLDELEWMDGETRARARAKLEQMAFLIGYPDRWKQYDFAIDRKSHAANVLAAQAWETRRNLAKIGKPVDRNEWQMSPPTINAYYDPQHNHMVFPAGILQPPFYDVRFAVAVNFGGIGMVVGHELTHGFDDEGSQFDGNGNLANWWAPATAEKFAARTGCVADQYSKYEALPDAFVDGKLTLGENIADLGGLKLAFHAYRALRQDAPEAVEADGLTEDQIFFVAHGQLWCSKYRDEFLKMMVQTNSHSPARFRVNGPASNLPEFHKAFSCAPGTRMHPVKSCSVW